MEKDELIKQWAGKLFTEIASASDGGAELRVITETLNSVYNVGFEAGRDDEKLRIQLSKHGKPYGYETD